MSTYEDKKKLAEQFPPETNVLVEFESIKDILKAYCKARIDFLEKRINSEINRLESESGYLNECFNFVSEVVEQKIDVRTKKSVLENTLKEKGYTFIDKLISMPISSLTEDKVKELDNKLKNKLLELENMRKETPISLWKKDLKELEEQIG